MALEPEPFRTTNAQLAFALMCAGCTFAPDVQDGPATNVYSLGFLRQERFQALFEMAQKKRNGLRLDIEIAAQMLIDREIPGNVIYCFVRNATWQEALAAWDEFTDELQDSQLKQRQPILPNISAKVTAQVLCAAAQNSAIFKKVPFMNKRRQMVSTMRGTTTHHPIANKNGSGDLPAPKSVTQGKGKAWTIGSKEIREHLKV